MRQRCLALLAALAIAGAQQQSSPPDPVIRITVNLVQVDAVVTDSHDRPVTNLKASDFEILQDGKRQAITHFSYINTRPAQASATPAPSPSRNLPKGLAPPPVRIKPGDVRRTLALVVDDLGLSFDSIARVRQSLKKFVDTEMQPGDLVAIIRTGSGMGALQQFTADKRLLYAAIDRVRYNAFGRVGVSSFTPLGSEQRVESGNSGDSPTADDERSSIFTAGSLGAIRYVVDGLRELPGRKSILLFSENMTLFSDQGVDERVMDALRHLVDAANRSSVVIYTIDPRGLEYFGLTAADNTAGMSALQVANVASQRSRQEFLSRDGLVVLAHDTGGLFLHDMNDVGRAVRKAVEDSEGYYLIGYRPDSSTFDSKNGGEARFHHVAVRVKAPGLHVRTRTGFFGTTDRERRETPQTRIAQIQHALTSPFGAAAIHVRLTPLFSAIPKASSYLNTMLYIDARDLHFTDEPDGWHKAVFDVVTMTFGDNGQPIDSVDKTFTMRANGKTYEDALQRGIIYNVAHPVKKPGAYQMRAVVRDTVTGETGSASQFIEVPDVRKGRLTLSSVILKEMTPDAAPAVAHPEGHVDEADPEGSAAVRIFHPGSSVLYAYEVINPQPQSVHGKQLEVQTRLFRDGKQIYAGEPKSIDVAKQPDPKRVITGGNLKLTQAPPGDYLFQVIVTDKLAREKYRTATSYMDFEVK